MAPSQRKKKYTKIFHKINTKYISDRKRIASNAQLDKLQNPSGSMKK
jgi:hypothetical protein